MKVVFYTIGCPQCLLVERKLKEKCIPYDEKNDIEEMINFLSFQNKYDFASKLYNDYRNDLEKNNYIASMVCHFIILIGQEDYEELDFEEEEDDEQH